MIMECWVILIILAIMSYLCLSSGHRDYMIGVLPMCLVPLSHIVGSPLSRMIAAWTPIENTVLIHIAVDLVGLVICCILLGGISRAIRKRSSRLGYSLLCGGFSVILAWVLIFNLIGAGGFF